MPFYFITYEAKTFGKKMLTEIMIAQSNNYMNLINCIKFVHI